MDRDLDEWSFEMRDSEEELLSKVKCNKLFEFVKQINAAQTSTRSPPCPVCTENRDEGHGHTNKPTIMRYDNG